MAFGRPKISYDCAVIPPGKGRHPYYVAFRGRIQVTKSFIEELIGLGTEIEKK